LDPAVTLWRTVVHFGAGAEVGLATVRRIARVSRNVIGQTSWSAQCADIYKTCLETLASDEKVDSEVRKTLGKVLERAKGIEDARERAWQLRKGLDYAYHAVAG
jgi:predicted NBD/HSP70 family sugar kinase